MTRRRPAAVPRAIEDMTESWLWELANQIQNRIPDPVDYVEMRRMTFGSDLTMSLARLAHGDEVPPEIYLTRAMRGLDNSAADFACLLNDIFSYQKEIEFEGEINNGVLVVRNFLDCDTVTAVAVVNDLMTARMQQFERIVATELPALFDNFDLGAEARAILTGYVQELRDWMAGVLLWHRETRRYPEFELRRLPLARTPMAQTPPSRMLPSGPTGLGTSAANIPLRAASTDGLVHQGAHRG